jgi:hypothetical protein
VAEKNAEKKHRTQKVKPKAAPSAAATSTVESKKHLASVRVIQRNLVYIIGLPAHLCNESVSSHPNLIKLCDMFKFYFSYQLYYYYLFRYLSVGSTLANMGKF